MHAGRSAARRRRPRTESRGPTLTLRWAEGCASPGPDVRRRYVHNPGRRMEDYEAQEQEFWRKLQEMDMSRSQMLKRSFAAAAGLTILSSPWPRGASARRHLRLRLLDGGVGQAGEEGAQAQHDRAHRPGRRMFTFSKKYGIPIDNANPNGSSADENQAVRSLKGGSSRTGRRRRRPRVRRVARGSLRQVLPVDVLHDSALDDDARVLVRRSAARSRSVTTRT